MAEKPTILIQLDVDPHPSVFDAVVAVDSGVHTLLQYANVTPEAVRDLVHGALFTRGPADLRHTALFIGGSDVTKAEAVLAAVRSTFFGPFRVSTLLDPNGSNTTAAAAVLAILKGCGGSVEGETCFVLGGTGPVGRRVARLLAREGARVSIGSRQVEKARPVAESIAEVVGTPIGSFASSDPAAIAEATVVVAAGAAGVGLISEKAWSGLEHLKVLVDLNAVPPAGIEGVDPRDDDADKGEVRAWGALGVGGTKMKVHKRAIRSLFEANDRILDAEEILALARS